VPAKDHYHDTVKRALVNDGWVILREHYPIRVALKRVWIDLSAEKEDSSAVALIEVKDFEDAGSVESLRDAIGQYALYRTAMKYAKLDNISLFLAIPQAAFAGIFASPLGKLTVSEMGINLIVFNPETEEIEQWLPYTK
jgi:hypothetical protein